MATIYRQKNKTDLNIISSVFAPADIEKDGDILFKVGKSNKKLYRVFIYIDGNSSHLVKSVKYYLHRSFKKNVITVNKSLSNLNTSIAIWTWGLFELRAKVLLNNDEIIELNHYLDYDKEIVKYKNRLKELK